MVAFPSVQEVSLTSKHGLITACQLQSSSIDQTRLEKLFIGQRYAELKAVSEGGQEMRELVDCLNALT